MGGRIFSCPLSYISLYPWEAPVFNHTKENWAHYYFAPGELTQREREKQWEGEGDREKQREMKGVIEDGEKIRDTGMDQWEEIFHFGHICRIIMLTLY